MFKQGVMAAALVVVMGAVPAMAQETRAEVGFTLGWVFADGTDRRPILAGGELYDRMDPKDSFNWGFNVGFFVNPNVEVGFLFGQQMSALVADGTAKTEAGDITVTGYHGYVGYNAGASDAPIRPYLLFGMGATSYGGVDYTAANGQTGEIGGFSQFSTTWGGGVGRVRLPELEGRHSLTPPHRLMRRVGGAILLGLLRHRRRAVRQPVIQRRHRRQVLI
jgi:hypothetical protein